MNVSDVPVRINWFANPTAIAHSLGLEIELPDLDNDNPEYWERFDHRAWREALAGYIAMTDEELSREDPDWVRLKRLGEGAEVWFDLEEGIVFTCAAGQAQRLVAVIRALAERDQLALTVDGQRAVVAAQTTAGGDTPFGEELADVMRPAGFQWEHNRWTLVP